MERGRLPVARCAYISGIHPILWYSSRYREETVAPGLSSRGQKLAGSSNGRTTGFGPVYLGSSPSPAAETSTSEAKMPD